ncbi:MAG: T9SS type A sorting domain-containing protein [Bacteroidales bacterium]|nr:T9SS type A sorting domain-containing protein [Bacteroidales bacterium]
MNKPARFLTLLALAASAVGVRAADDAGVSVIGWDAEDARVGYYSVNLNSKIRFTSDRVEIYDGDKRTGAFDYASVAKLTFHTGQVGVASVAADASTLRLLTNPVGEMLEMTGLQAESAPLVITSLNGETKLSLAEWRGEAVDVSSLTPGLYFVTVNRTTLKFIKK